VYEYDGNMSISIPLNAARENMKENCILFLRYYVDEDIISHSYVFYAFWLLSSYLEHLQF
jgi:hypothetical protein